MSFSLARRLPGDGKPGSARRRYSQQKRRLCDLPSAKCCLGSLKTENGFDAAPSEESNSIGSGRVCSVRVLAFGQWRPRNCHWSSTGSFLNPSIKKWSGEPFGSNRIKLFAQLIRLMDRRDAVVYVESPDKIQSHVTGKARTQTFNSGSIRISLRPGHVWAVTTNDWVKHTWEN